MSTPRSLSNLRRLGLSLLLIGSLAATQTACGEAGEGPTLDAEDAQGISYGRDDSGRIAPNTPEGDAVVAFVNQPLSDDAAAQGFLTTLKSELHELPATAIHDFRVGADGAAGTADDATFADLKAIDDLPYTGPAAFEQLLTLATNAGFFTPAGGDCQEFTTRSHDWRSGDTFWRVTTYAQLLRIRDSGCTFFSKGVVIETGNDELLPDARQLEPLSNVTRIDGTLTIKSSPALTGLSGLRNLTEVDGLHIENNRGLVTLDGLQGLTSLPGDLILYGNPELTSLEGLQSLTSIDGNVRLYNLASLVSLQALDGLTRVGGSLSLESNRQLTSLQGLGGLTEVGGLGIGDGNGFDDLQGLGALQRIGGALSVGSGLFGDTTLLSFTGLTSLVSLGTLEIEGDDDVASLDGLESLERIDDTLRIEKSAITSLAPLANLREARAIILKENASLDLVGVFPALESVGNLSLTTSTQAPITGFDRLETIRGGLGIHAIGTPQIDAFAALTSAASLNFRLPVTMATLDGFGSLRAVEGSVSIGGEKIADLRSLNSLEIIGYLNLNTKVNSLQGLAGLTTIEGSLTVNYSSNLDHLDNLSALRNVGGDIVVNRSFPQDALDRFLNQLEYFQGSIERK